MPEYILSSSVGAFGSDTFSSMLWSMYFRFSATAMILAVSMASAALIMNSNCSRSMGTPFCTMLSYTRVFSALMEASRSAMSCLSPAMSRLMLSCVVARGFHELDGAVMLSRASLPIFSCFSLISAFTSS